jgi:putative nucleotidyltransferase with HDIG domain
MRLKHYLAPLSFKAKKSTVIMQKLYAQLEEWFGDYVMQFHSKDSHFQKNIEVKREHSYQVHANMEKMAIRMELNEEQQLVAEAIGLLHDIGRFEQFRRYQTFYDKVSVDHADLGVSVLQELNVLKEWPQEAQEWILTAIKWHNKKALPEDLSETERLYCKLIRDADKLDIWRVVTAYYCRMDEETNNTLQLDLPDTPGYQPINVERIRQHEMVDLQDLKNLNDFKLLQVGWVFDINFATTLALLKQRNYLTPLFASLPNDDIIGELKKEVENYIEKVLTNNG